MRFSADVVHQSVRPADDDRFNTAPMEAADEWEAARRVADLAARRRYGDEGQSGFITRVGAYRFRATIGDYYLREGQAVTVGVTVAIHILAQD